MAINKMQNVQQAYVLPGEKVRAGQVPVQLELFDAEGQPFNFEGASGGITQEQMNSAIQAAVEPLETRIQDLESAQTNPEE